MDHYQASAHRAELLIRIISILVILAGAGIAVYMLLTADQVTIALLQGAMVGSLVMGACGFACGWIAASRRQQPQRVEGEVVEGVIEGEAREVPPVLTTWRLVERRTGKTLIEVKR